MTQRRNSDQCVRSTYTKSSHHSSLQSIHQIQYFL